MNSAHGKGKLQFRKSKLSQQNLYSKTVKSDSLLNQNEIDKSDSPNKTNS